MPRLPALVEEVHGHSGSNTPDFFPPRPLFLNLVRSSLTLLSFMLSAFFIRTPSISVHIPCGMWPLTHQPIPSPSWCLWRGTCRMLEREKERVRRLCVGRVAAAFAGDHGGGVSQHVFHIVMEILTRVGPGRKEHIRKARPGVVPEACHWGILYALFCVLSTIWYVEHAAHPRLQPLASSAADAGADFAHSHLVPTCNVARRHLGTVELPRRVVQHSSVRTAPLAHGWPKLLLGPRYSPTIPVAHPRRLSLPGV